MKLTILMTCAGGELSPKMYNQLRGLSDFQIKIVAIDSNANAVGSHFADKFYTTPMGNHPEYIDKLIEICRAEKVNLIIPGSDEEALNISQNIQYFNAIGTQATCIPFEKLKIFSNKSKTYDQLKEFGFEVPKYVTVTDSSSLKDQLNKMLLTSSQIVIKPSVSRGGRNIYHIDLKIKDCKIVDNQFFLSPELFLSDYLPKLKENFPLVLMEELVGPVHDIDLLASEGVALCVVPRRRVHPNFPNLGHEIVHSTELIALGNKIIKDFKLSYLYDVDVMFTQNGRPVVLEINPRQSGSIATTIESGVPVFDILLKSIFKLKYEIPNIPFGKKIIPYKDLKSF